MKSEDFFNWLKEVAPNIYDRCQFVSEDNDPVLSKWSCRVNVFTRTHKYLISAHWKGSSIDSYLGCIANNRKPRAGETWTRGNDLPSGKLTRETWEDIKDAILSYELCKIAKRERKIPAGTTPGKRGYGKNEDGWEKNPDGSYTRRPTKGD